MLRAAMEWLITHGTPQGRRAFFDCNDFAWVPAIEAGFTAIRRELEGVLQDLPQVPNLQDLSPDQQVLTEGEQWKSLIFHAYGRDIAENCARCPQTARLLQGIPGLKSAMFSILAPHKRLPPHRGPYKGVLRYHLGLLIPPPASASGICVAGQTRHWAEGKSLIFDDSHEHEAWNGTDAHRVVLFVDFMRPLPLWLVPFNHAMVWRLSTTPLVRVMVGRGRAAARQWLAGQDAGRGG
ncbi:MAG: aspartyl/asparaginyl beta-hydroxylase domain-containing protein [Rubrivivax sp.]|nr:aspartyl/asparaginyl beta-hydroxylase domain-containing protein [Rubrivivax sp.]MDP3222571.1 aspartyl/asparaginyl beta-hydroxylase domain-containing protein [Rubrivivax sp.]MDP3613395.1 aspartyl/asparaginyl beta-hydroxylase domain-containing protein [Rubrivivax sp.]